MQITNQVKLGIVLSSFTLLILIIYWIFSRDTFITECKSTPRNPYGTTTIGFIEKVYFVTKDGLVPVCAKMDSGAVGVAIHETYAEKWGLQKNENNTKRIRSSNGTLEEREVYYGSFTVAQVLMQDTEITVTDRTNLDYAVIVGREGIPEGFLIDPKKHDPDNEKEED